MEKQANANANCNGPPLGTGTSTSSGVTVFTPTAATVNNILPPTYDQAMAGNATTPFAAAASRSYTTTTSGWIGPGLAPNPMHTTTTYTSYGTSVPQPPPQASRDPPRQATFVQPPPVVIIQQQPMVPLGPEPVYLTCPGCHIQKLTRIEYEPSSRTHLMAALLCLIGLWCCVCLPYCAGSCMNTHHYCGNCGKFLGTYGNAL